MPVEEQKVSVHMRRPRLVATSLSVAMKQDTGGGLSLFSRNMVKRIEDPRAERNGSDSVVQRALCTGDIEPQPSSTCVVLDKTYTHRLNASASVKPAVLLDFDAG
jgi:hypothetical protein